MASSISRSKSGEAGERRAIPAMPAGELGVFILGLVLGVLGLLLLGARSYAWPVTAAPLGAGYTNPITALCFVSAGTVLAAQVAPKHNERFCTIGGIILVLLGMLAMANALWGSNPQGSSTSGPPVYIIEASVTFLRSTANSLQTALVFVASGIALALMGRMRQTWSGLLVQIVLCLLIAGAASILVERALGHMLFHTDNGFPEMDGLIAATGLVLLPLGLLLRSFRSPWARSFYGDREDRQVFLLNAMLTFLIVLLAGGSVGCVLSENYLASFQETLKLTHRANAMLFQNMLENASLQVLNMLHGSKLPVMLGKGGKAPVEELEAQLRLLVNGEKSVRPEWTAVFDVRGTMLASAGTPQSTAELRVPLGGWPQSWLLWRNGWVVEVRVPVLYQARRVGELRVEKPIAGLREQFDYTRQLGKTGEVLVCTRESDQMACFPSRLVQSMHRESLTYQGELIPMGRALLGQSGAGIARDYRGITVVSAYGQVPGTPLGLVQKIDAADMFPAVQSRIWRAILLMLPFSLAGALLLARWVRPIVLELVRTRTRLAAVLDHVPSAILKTDLQGRITSVNRAAEIMFAAPGRRLLGSPVADLFPGIDLRPPPERRDEQRAVRPVSLQGCRMNGSVFPAELVTAYLTLDGQPQMIHVVRDMSALKTAEAGLRESERRLQGIAANVPGVVFQCTRTNEEPSLAFTYVSRGVDELFGLDPDAVRTDPGRFLACLGGQDQEAFIAAMEDSSRSLTQWNWEGRINDLHGKDKWVNLRATPRHSAVGGIIWDGVIFNVTDSKRNEENLRRLSAMLRELSAHTEAVREDERKRIAREVHDELGQTLTALRMDVSLLRRDLAPHGPEMMKRLQSMRDLVDQTIRTARHVITALRPPALDHGINAALEWLVMEFSSRSKIACSLDVSGHEIALEESREITLFRIVQEALTNVARHAQASAVSVVIWQSGNRLQIDITDNGRGFDPDCVDSMNSFGLVGIRERTLMLGGTVTVTSGPGRGTRLAVDIPLRAEHEWLPQP